MRRLGLTSIFCRGVRLLTRLLFVLLVSSCCLQAQVSNAKSSVSSAPDNAKDYRTLLNRYCVVCHNEKAQIGGLALDKIDLTQVPEHSDIWEKVDRKLRSEMMPPQGMPRPSATQVSGFVDWLEATLDHEASARPNPGPSAIRRMTRTEYGNAIHDLLDLNVDAESMLPGEGYSNEGFDNDAAALGISPALMERYVSAAWKTSALAVGTMDVTSTVNTFRPRSDVSQDKHIEGLPLGTRGGIVVHYNFPVDGLYIFRTKFWRNNVQQLRGVRVHLGTFGGVADEAYANNSFVAAGLEFEKRMEVQAPVKAGPHDVGFAFLQKSAAVPMDLIEPLERENLDGTASVGIPTLSSAIIIGPLSASGPGETPSRRRIFVCRPPEDNRDGGACANKILSRLARLAYRRSPTKKEVDSLMAYYDFGRKHGGADNGIETALSYILASPQFIFRSEPNPGNVTANVPFQIDDYELATRLSFFIWSSIPDEKLLTLAGQGKLRNPTVLSEQVHRMLKDERSSALVLNFADEWLRLRNLKAADFNDVLFPDFDDNLRQSFRRETELFFESVLRENRNVIDLINANYTFLDHRLADHYGIPHVEGSQFRRVELTDPNRFGLLGQGSFLTVTSYGNRTSPVIRGKYVLSILMGNPPPPMPSNVPPLNETVDPTKPLSMRQRMDAHRANPVCANCHRLMDPIGFSLENFDATGKWRADDGGAPIDPSGVIATGAHVDGPASLRKAIASRPEQFVRTLTEALMTYALGRKLEAYDMPGVRAIVRQSAQQNDTMESLIQGIVSSVAFRMKLPEAGKPAQQGGAPTAQNIQSKVGSDKTVLEATK